MAPARQPLKDRICRTHRKEGECWVWTGCYGRDGYGVLTVGRKQVRAHRASWEAFKGFAPGVMIVCHACDNPSCVNPDHLFLGTPADNAQDRDAKGRNRAPTVETHPLYKLTAADRDAIRQLRADGAKLKEIADEFGVSFQTVSEICIRKRAYAAA